MLTCDASVIVGYDRRRPRLCNAAIIRKYDNYSCHRDIAISLNIAPTWPALACMIHVPKTRFAWVIRNRLPEGFHC